MNTKYLRLLMVSALVASPLVCLGIAKAMEQEEVPVEKVFVPALGYDDNDNVVIRVEGTLPDPCYVLGNTEVKVLPDKTFEVHQYAWRRDSGICAGRDDLEESPFSEDVSLGQLTAGDYRIAQHPADAQTTFRPLNVAKSVVGTMDDFNYANATQVSVPDVVLASQDVIATVTGTLASSCNLITDVKVERQGDVFVVRPIEAKKGDCGYILKYFKKEVSLGKLPVGEYMIHVRAKNGRAVERTFQVLSVN